MAVQRQGWGLAGHGRRREANPRAIVARKPRAAQPARAHELRPDPVQQEYAFLVGMLIDHATLGRATAEARRCGVATHEALLAAGWLSQADYAAALGRKLGVPVVTWEARLDLADALKEAQAWLHATK